MTASSLTRLRAFFGPLGGGPPDYTQTQSEVWTVRQIRRSAGGSQPDFALLQRALTDQVINREALFQRREVHIWIVDETYDDDEADYFVTPLFWGEVLRNGFRISANPTDSETAVAAVHRYHFGELLDGEHVYEPNEDATVVMAGDVRFNPLGPDGRIDGNMADIQADPGFPSTYNLWIDPESARSTESATVHEQTAASQWSLPRAVATLQKVLNEDETYIFNKFAIAEEDAEWEDVETPRNVMLKRGLHLDQCLDILLPPYGRGWWVNPETADAYSGALADLDLEPRLTYFQRGVGTEKDIKLQAPGSTLDTDLSDLVDASITYDLANLKTQVIVAGQVPEREVTVELHKYWLEADDGLTVDEIDIDTGAYRWWGANEDGSWDGARPEITAHLDLDEVFGAGEWTPRRRTLHRPLTFRGQATNESEGLRRPVTVEVSDDGGSTWHNVKDPGDYQANFSVVPGQMSIWFNDAELPDFLVDADLQVRVTATITGDVAPRVEATVPSEVPTSAQIPLYIDGSDRFFDRARHEYGTLASVLTGAHDERDDETTMQTFADAVLLQEFAAAVVGPLTLRGILTDYEIGDLITGISGRSISFNRTSDDENPKYPQVVGIEWSQDGPRQTTRLLLAPYDAPPSMSRAPRGRV